MTPLALLRRFSAVLAVSGTLALAAVAARPPSPAPTTATTTLRQLYGLTLPEQLSRAHTAVLFVDWQEEMFHGRLPVPDAERASRPAQALASWARQHGILRVHVQNIASKADSPLFAAGTPGARIVPTLQPQTDDLLITKSLLGAFSRTALHQELQRRGITTLLITGLMTHLAVQVTAADATLLGYRAIVVADAVATRALPGSAGLPSVDAATLQRATLASLADRVADVSTSQRLMSLQLSP